MVSPSDILRFVGSRLASPAVAKTRDQWVHASLRTSDINAPKYAGNRTNDELIKRMAQTVAYCVHLKASTAASVPMRLYTKEKPSRAKGFKTRALSKKQRAWLEGVQGKAAEYAGGDDFVEVTEHPALDLLRRPNEWRSGQQFAYQRFMYQELCGSAFVHVSNEGGSEPVAMFNLIPSFTTIVASEADFVSHYYYGREGGRIETFPAEEVDHYIYAPHPTLPLQGMCPLHWCLKEADLAAYATEAEIYRWLQGGQPPAVVKLPAGSTKTEVDDAHMLLQKHMGGIKNAGRWLVLIDSEVKPTGFAPKDLEYQAGLDRSDLIVARCYGVPESFLKMNDANLTSAGAGARWFRENAILPRLMDDADELTNKYLPRWGIMPGEMWFAPDNCVPQDEAAQSTQASTLYGAGIITLNEARMRVGEDPWKGPEGDDLKAPAPSPFGAAPGEKPEPEDGEDPEEDKPEPTDDTEEPEDDGPEAKSRADHGPRRGGRVRAGKHSQPTEISGVSDHRCGADAKAAGRNCSSRGGLTAKDDRVDPRAIVAKFEAELAAWYGKVPGAIKPDGTIDFSAIGPELDQIIARNLEAMFRSGMMDAFAGIGDDPATYSDGINRRARDFLAGYTPRLSGTLTETLAADLKVKLDSIIGDPLTGERVPLAEAVDRVRGILPDETGWRAERVVRTEEAFISRQSALQAWTEAGASHKEWLLSSEPCPICEQIAADNPGAVPVGQPFEGEPTWYGPLQGPPAHPACQCDIAPVFEDELKTLRALSWVVQKGRMKKVEVQHG